MSEEICVDSAEVISFSVGLVPQGDLFPGVSKSSNNSAESKISLDCFLAHAIMSAKSVTYSKIL